MHVSQRSVYGQMIFYDLEDYLVFYMIFSVYARHYRVKVLELCIMPNHVHMILHISAKDTLGGPMWSSAPTRNEMTVR